VVRRAAATHDAEHPFHHVEDWHHILDVELAPELSRWDDLPVRVEANLRHLMNILAERRVPRSASSSATSPSAFRIWSSRRRRR
jgi:hypothetical protein